MKASFMKMKALLMKRIRFKTMKATSTMMMKRAAMPMTGTCTCQTKDGNSNRLINSATLTHAKRSRLEERFFTLDVLEIGNNVLYDLDRFFRGIGI
jgi:hypothetical protein